MIHRFVLEAVKEREIKIEVIEERKKLKTVIKYPEPDPRDRIFDEYGDTDQSE